MRLHDPRSVLASGIKVIAAIAFAAVVAAAPAAAQAPDNVQYLPQDGAAIILWTAPAGNVTGYNVYQQVVTDPNAQPAAGTKVTPGPVGTATSLRVENLTNGTAYHFTVSAIVDGVESDKVGPAPAQTDQGDVVAVVPQKPVQLAGAGAFYGNNIGTDFPGSHEVAADGKITIKASGWDIQNDADGFYFLAMPMAGDITITVQTVSGPTATANDNDWNLGGPMIRETLDSRSRFAMMQVARKGCLQFKRRLEFGESPPGPCTDAIDPEKRPVWLRVSRKGDDFSGFISEDGTTWTQADETATIANFAKEPYVGLSLAAHEDGQYSTIVFDNFKITPTP